MIFLVKLFELFAKTTEHLLPSSVCSNSQTRNLRTPLCLKNTSPDSRLIKGGVCSYCVRGQIDMFFLLSLRHTIIYRNVHTILFCSNKKRFINEFLLFVGLNKSLEGGGVGGGGNYDLSSICGRALIQRNAGKSCDNHRHNLA